MKIDEIFGKIMAWSFTILYALYFLMFEVEEPC